MIAKQLILGLLMMVLTAGFVAAGLEFGDIEVKIDGEKTDNLEDGDHVGDEAKPGDKISVDVEVSSNFTNSDEDEDGDEIDIENIGVTVTLEGIDDGDDLDADFELDDLGPGDDDSGNVDFVVPLEAGEDSYDILIEVEAEDTNGTDYNLDMRISFDVEKENHEVRITRATLNPSSVSCGRASVASVTVLNTGAEDEEDNTITLSNSDLDLELTDTFDVQEGEFDEDQEYSRTFTLPTTGADSGSYPIDVRVVYDDGGEEVSQTLELEVTPCGSSASNEDDETPSVPSTPSTPTTGTGTSGTSTGTASPSNSGTTVVVAQPSTPEDVFEPTTTESTSLFDNPSFTVGLLVIEIVIVIVGIAFVAYLMRRG